MSGRVPYLVFAACVGVAAALLFYRFGVMPLGWSASITPLFDVAPAVLVAVSWQSLRRARAEAKAAALAGAHAEGYADGKTEGRAEGHAQGKIDASAGSPAAWPVLPMVGVGLVGAAAAALLSYALVPTLATAKISERQFPGFSISLPEGEEKPSEKSYSAGRLELLQVADLGGSITLRWEPGESMDEEDLATFARALAAAVDAPVSPFEQWAGPDGAKVPTLVMRSKGGNTVWGSILMCGGRRISLVSGGPAAMAQLHRRILPTIRCQQDAASEAKLGSLPWTIELPAGWFALDAPAGQTQLTDGARAILVRTGAELANREALPKLLSALFSAGKMKVSLGAWEGDRMAMQGAMDDGTPFWGGVWLKKCPGSGLLVITMAEDEKSAAELAELVEQKGRCLRAGEAPTVWPTQPEEQAPPPANPATPAK